MRRPGPARVQSTSLRRAALLVMACASVWAADWNVQAADHLDPPARTDPAVDSTPDKAADIADLYVWHTSDNLVVALTFAGPQSATLPATYDRDMLYTINISNAGFPTDAEIQIRFRFGQDGTSTGVEVSGLPDGGGPLVGPVEQILVRNGIQVRAGLYDDPFFFDLEGFRTTRSTGTLAFNKDRSFFSGQNLTAVVIQIPLSRVTGSAPLNLWATSARLGGQI